ncbi:MAG: hypothetical protein R8K47_07055, partial [Mariprofundaceae bacterium]
MEVIGEIRADSLPAAFFEAARLRGDAPAQWHRTQQGYRPISYREMAARIRALASGLIAHG